MRAIRILLPVAFLLTTFFADARAVTVVLSASKDNTLYESATGATSNGAGEHLFTGKTKNNLARRAVIAFNIGASVPEGSTINSVELRLNLSRAKQNTLRNTSLHRVLADWGEGGSNADQNEGQGAPADTNDCTWIHRFRYPDALWTTPGGDYNATASATAAVGGNAFYSWSGAGLVADVQAWLDDPASNFGWLVRGDESATETAKRFDSSENQQTTRRPQLTIDFTPPAGGATGACCYADTCEVVTAAVCTSLGGAYQGDGTTCVPDPCPIGGQADSVFVSASKDNTLYEDATGSLSNGLGTKLIASRNSGGLIRRGLVAFDVAAAVPSGAVVTSATLTLYNAQGGTNTTNVTLHRVTADWGEGTSVATGSEDAGAPVTNGDATWIHRFYPGSLWTAPGGDYNATASATASVANEGFYSWSSAELAADIQAWRSNPSSNHGWIVRGREGGGANALKRFESRQSTDSARRPQLKIVYAMPTELTGACCLPDASCDTLTAAECAAAGGTYQGDGTVCDPAPYCPLVLEPFVDPLPLPSVAAPVSGTAGGAASYQIVITEFSQKLHRDLPLTRVWGYAGSYPGPTIEASMGQPVQVTWVNDLRDSLGVLRTQHYLPVDLCMSGPDREGATARTVVHLHGGHVPPESDGHPEDTILPGGLQTFHYPNQQLPATLWYHDHAMGITRLNVMMGLAGFYLLRDSVETALGLPAGPFEIPLAIQDRMFRADGSMVYPPAWEEHSFGDKAVVNGKVWPYLNVRRGKYRFRILNGSNARAYTLHLSTGASFQVIGSEGGLLTAPVTVDSVTITPGERADVIFDFAAYPAGTEILLTNSAPAPFPMGGMDMPEIPHVMKFVVENGSAHTDPIPAALRPVVPLLEAEAVQHRDLVLEKTPVAGGCGGTQWTINGLGFGDVTEFPVLGTTEVWRFVNRSGTTHPMHMHLVMFQILDRQPFTVVNDSIVPIGSPIPPEPWQAGWKDTAPVPPNELLRVIARFEGFAGRYPYHCHILEHEDHEMMRQFRTVHAPVTAVETAPAAARLALHPSRPNPFNPSTRIGYELPRRGRARLEVFDVTGRLVATLARGVQEPGLHHVVWDGRNRSGSPVGSGVYTYRLVVEGERTLARKMILLK